MGRGGRNALAGTVRVEIKRNSLVFSHLRGTSRRAPTVLQARDSCARYPPDREASECAVHEPVHRHWLGQSHCAPKLIYLAI